VQPKNNNAESRMLGVHRVSSPATPGTVNLNATAPPHSRNAAHSLSINGFVSKKTEDPKALKLLIAASEYAAAAMCRAAQDATGIPAAPPHLIDRYVDIVFGLEVHFVFPNLSADKRDLLVSIMKVRNSISAVLNGASRGRSAGEKAAIEELIADLKGKFLEFRSQIVESAIEEQLDPVQKKVFQDEFFSITLDKTSSTTLFIRTEAPPPPASGTVAVRAPEEAGRSDFTLRRAPVDSIPPSGPGLQTDGLEPHRRTHDRLAKPVIDRDIDVAPRRPEHRAPGRKTVLLISADPGAQEQVGHSLRQAGYNLLLATAGFSGYSSAMRERPDLVLLDLRLSFEVSGPNACLDGRGVLKMLSQLPSNRALPFIGLVPNDGSEAEAQVLASGATACLQMPVDPSQVLGAVQNALKDLPMETDEATRSPWTVSASV